MTTLSAGSLTTKPWVKPVVLAVVLGFLLVALTATRSHRTLPVATSPETLTQEVRSLRGEVDRLRAAEPTRVYVVAPPAAASPSASAPIVAADEEQREEEPERQRDAVDELKMRFESEPIDAAWNASMQRDIRDSISTSLPTARLLGADCATSLCRVVIAHDSEADQRSLAGQVAGAKPFQEGVLYDYDQTPNALKTTLYVLRQGSSFRD